MYINIITSNKECKLKEYRVDNKTLVDFGVGIAIITIMQDKVYANPINDALKPLINVLQDLAEPVSYGFMVKGFLQIMAGDDHAGQKTIKSAIGGFLGIQFIPKIFAIIRGVKI